MATLSPGEKCLVFDKNSVVINLGGYHPGSLTSSGVDGATFNNNIFYITPLGIFFQCNLVFRPASEKRRREEDDAAATYNDFRMPCCQMEIEVMCSWINTVDI